MRVKPTIFLIGIFLFSIAISSPPVVFAQDDVAPPAQSYSQQELDQMLAPIALYPDALLSQVLMASTYPLEVVQAARWSKAHQDLKGDDAVNAAQQNNWDPSVVSLTAFPQILAMMDEKLDWTERLGNAFLAQQSQVMDTTQNLRQKAMAAGNLQSDEQIRVQPQGQTIIIQQAAPQVVYVPYYNPTVVYGPWWWEAYPPVYWDPWPGYYRRPGLSVGFYWGAGIAVGGGFFYGNFDWHRHHVNVVNVNNYYYRNYYDRHPGSRNGPPSHNGGPPRNPPPNGGTPGAWRHDPDHRHGVQYQGNSIQQQYGGRSRPSPSSDTRYDSNGNNAHGDMTGRPTPPNKMQDQRDRGSRNPSQQPQGQQPQGQQPQGQQPQGQQPQGQQPQGQQPQGQQPQGQQPQGAP
ncbi:MAG: DUF3300 domain-containing protein, partial [Methylophilaceae bacterium]